MSETATEAAAGADAGTDAADSLFDLAEQSDATIAKDDAGKPVKPDWINDQFWDAEKGEPKLREMATSWADLRGKISRGEHKPPESPDKYAPPAIEGLPAGLIGGKDDTLWPAVTKAAHAAGLTQKQLEAIATPVLAQMAAAQAEADPARQAEARRAAAAAELAQLGPNARQVVADTAAWLNGLEANGSLTRDEVLAARGMSNAAGIRLLGKLRQLTGDKPIPTEAFQEDGMTIADARRLMDEGYAKNDQGMIAKARAALTKAEAAGATW